MTTVYGEMTDDSQPQRALHNWLKDFVDMVGDMTTRMPSGEIKKYASADVVSWIRQFCDTYEDVAEDESGNKAACFSEEAEKFLAQINQLPESGGIVDKDERMAKIVEIINGDIVETPCRVMQFVVGETKNGAVVALGCGGFVYVPMENLQQEKRLVVDYKRKYEELVEHIKYKAEAATHWLKSKAGPSKFISKSDIFKMSGQADAFNIMLCYTENETY